MIERINGMVLPNFFRLRMELSEESSNILRSMSMLWLSASKIQTLLCLNAVECVRDPETTTQVSQCTLRVSKNS